MEKIGSGINILDPQYVLHRSNSNNGELTHADVRELREVVAGSVELSAPEFLNNFDAIQAKL